MPGRSLREMGLSPLLIFCPDPMDLSHKYNGPKGLSLGEVGGGALKCPSTRVVAGWLESLSHGSQFICRSTETNGDEILGANVFGGG